MTVSIERAVAGDLDAVLPLVAGYRIFYRQQAQPEHERAFVHANLEDERSVIFIAYEDRADPSGFVQLFQTYSTVWLGPQLILEDLFVKPEARGSGIASKLLERALQYAREIEAVGMFLETAMDNHTAQSVYERAGWTREGKFYKYNAPL